MNLFKIHILLVLATVFLTCCSVRGEEDKDGILTLYYSERGKAVTSVDGSKKWLTLNEWTTVSAQVQSIHLVNQSPSISEETSSTTFSIAPLSLGNRKIFKIILFYDRYQVSFFKDQRLDFLLDPNCKFKIQAP